jgi:hypothetical protein
MKPAMRKKYCISTSCEISAFVSPRGIDSRETKIKVDILLVSSHLEGFTGIQSFI